MNPSDRIKLNKHKFTKTDYKIYQYLLENPSKIVHGNVYEIADWIGVSRTAIIRFAKKLDYIGFSEFKYDFSRLVHSGNFNNNNPDETSIDYIVDIYQRSIAAIKGTLNEKALKKLIDRLINANKVKVFGLNRTGLAAIQLRQRFHKIDFDAEAVTDYILIPEVARQGHENDVHIFFSTLGETPIILEAIQNSYHRNVFTVVVTMNANSKMLKYSKLSLFLPSTDIFSSRYFFDLQVINFTFIEILVSYLGRRLSETQSE